MSVKDVDGFVMAAKERYGLEKRIVRLELFMKYLLQSEESMKKYNEWIESKGYEIRRCHFIHILSFRKFVISPVLMLSFYTV